jgi:hypothetical protein
MAISDHGAMADIVYSAITVHQRPVGVHAVLRALTPCTPHDDARAILGVVANRHAAHLGGGAAGARAVVHALEAAWVTAANGDRDMVLSATPFDGARVSDGLIALWCAEAAHPAAPRSQAVLQSVLRAADAQLTPASSTRLFRGPSPITAAPEAPSKRRQRDEPPNVPGAVPAVAVTPPPVRRADPPAPLARNKGRSREDAISIDD